MTENWISRAVGKVFEKQIERRVELAVRALDDGRDRTISREAFPRDRKGYDRDQVLADALEAWRTNPLARRLVELTSQYVVGGGLSIDCSHERTHQFLLEWWNHPLNHMATRVFEWCDELTRSGELFLLLSTDAAGMSYMRAIPAADVAEIVTAENDIEQEVEIYEKVVTGPWGSGDHRREDRGTGVTGGERDEWARGRSWKVYRERADEVGVDGQFETVIFHYTVNRPVGALHGESDLAPLLRWLARYAAWLEDRARLNRYRNSFLYWVKARFTGAGDRLKRQAELNANPPAPGSVLVTDESETWSVLAPNLASFEAAEDGLALKKMISAGGGVPLHFIAEPESSTRTTAESAGGPTFRHYQQRQLFFLYMVSDLARAVVRRRKQVDRLVNPEAEIQVRGSEISARDNAGLAAAAATSLAAFKELRASGLIDDAELLRVVYRFAGEVAPGRMKSKDEG